MGGAKHPLGLPSIEEVVAVGEDTFEARLVIYYAAKERGRGGEVAGAFIPGRTLVEIAAEFGLDGTVPPRRERMH